MRTSRGVLLALGALAFVGCKSWTDSIDTKMIAKDEFAESQGMAQMKRDVDECGTHAVREKQRLKAQLWNEDSYLEDQARGQAEASAVGREIGKEMVRPDPAPGIPARKPASGEINTERIAGDAAGAAAGFIWSALTSDSSKHEATMLTYDIDSLESYMRFKNACLRAKGYEVPEHAEDGAATPELRAPPLRVVLVHRDGRETVMYERPE